MTDLHSNPYALMISRNGKQPSTITWRRARG